MKLKNQAKPITIDKNTWCYVDSNTVEVIHEVNDDDGAYYRTIEIKLPLRIIETWFDE